MIEKEITGCIDCPFSYGYDMAVGSGCKIDDQNRDVQKTFKRKSDATLWWNRRVADNPHLDIGVVSWGITENPVAH